MTRRPRNLTVIKHFKRGDLFKLVPAVIVVIAIVGVSLAFASHNLSAKDTSAKSQPINTVSSSSKSCVAGSKSCKSSSGSSSSGSGAVASPTQPSSSSSSSTGSKAASTPATPAPIVYSSNQSQICASFYNTLEYQYHQSVDGLAGNLATSEDQGVNAAISGHWSLITLTSLINEDINSTNTAISNDWTSSFVTNLTSQCDSPPSVPKLQVPQCYAVILGSVANCISQINSSLGI